MHILLFLFSKFSYICRLPCQGVPVLGFLQFAVIHGSWERNDVTDVRHTGQIHHAALKSKSESGMSCGTVFAEVHIKAIVLLIKTKLLNPCKKLIVIVLSLAAADDLTNARYETVHSRHGPAVLI